VIADASSSWTKDGYLAHKILKEPIPSVLSLSEIEVRISFPIVCGLSQSHQKHFIIINCTDAANWRKAICENCREWNQNIKKEVVWFIDLSAEEQQLP
jgi:hypothetical protein